MSGCLALLESLLFAATFSFVFKEIYKNMSERNKHERQEE
jgi:hypothetical protein